MLGVNSRPTLLGLLLSVCEFLTSCMCGCVLQSGWFSRVIAYPADFALNTDSSFCVLHGWPGNGYVYVPGEMFVIFFDSGGETNCQLIFR